MDIKIGKSFIPETNYTSTKSNVKTTNESVVAETKEPALLEKLQEAALKTQNVIPNEKEAQTVKVKVEEGYGNLTEEDAPPHLPTKDSEALLGVNREA